MRYILAFILSVSAFFAQAQQVNPVTDYTFANRMSSGRSTVTDTAAYFSIGPRYGAVRGMMPPMVTDTTSMSANKRNGLLIFSIQKNKYQVWDSAGAKWADITGAAGSAIISADTAAMLLPYLRKADTTAMLLPYLRKSDTVWLSNRINLKLNISDTSSMLNPYLRGSGTANYFPKFDASRSVINSKLYESGTNLLFNTTNPSFTSAGITTIENNATSSAVYTYKIADTIRAYMGYGGSSTFDINNLRAGDIRFYTSATLRGRFQTDGTFRLNSLTGTGSRIVTADTDGVLSATSSATGLVDTTVLSTRAWRQKGDDSLGAIIATKGSGTVTSVATGYGLSGGTITTTGTIIVDSAIVASRLRVGKVVDSLSLVKQNVLTNPVTGTGTTNYVPKFTGTSTIGNSQIFDNGTNVGIGTTSPNFKLDVNGTFNVRSNYAYFGSDANTAVYAGSFSNEGRIGVGGRSSFPTANLTFFTADGTNNFERMRISSSGEVLVNTVSDAGDYKLQVSGNAYVNGNLYVNTTSGFNTLFTNPIGGGGVGMVSLSDPTANGNRLFSLGMGSVNYPAQARIEAYASEAWSSTNRGTYFVLRTTPNGGTTSLDRFYIGNDGFVGINTNSPLARLQVGGNFRTDNDAYFATSSGSVAIGRTNPSFKFDILTGTDGFDGVNVSNLNAGVNAVGGFRAINGNGIATIVGVTEYNASSAMGGPNQSVLYTIGNQNLLFGTNSTERARFNNPGEFLINTTTDAGDYKLQVSGNAYVSGSSTLGSTIIANNTPFITGSNIYASNSMAIGTNTSNFVEFYTNNTSRMLLTSAGELLVSTTTDAGDYKLQVSGNAYVTGTTVLAANGANVTVGSTTAVGRFGVVVNEANGAGVRLQNDNNSSYMTLTPMGGTGFGVIGWSNSSVIEAVPASTGGLVLSAYSGAIIFQTNTRNEKLRMHQNGGLKFVGQSSSPTAEAGTVYYDTDDNKLKVYNGTTWVDLH